MIGTRSKTGRFIRDDVIYVDESSFYVTSISNDMDGYVKLVAEIWVDPFVALANNAQEIDVSVYHVLPSEMGNLNKVPSNPKSYITNIKSRAGKTNNRISGLLNNSITNRKIDITSIIPNDAGMRSIDSAGSTSRSDDDYKKTKGIGINASPPGTPGASLVNSKMYLKSMNAEDSPLGYQLFSSLIPKINAQNSIDPSRISQLYRSLIFHDMIDPINAFNFPFPVLTPQSVLYGSSPPNNTQDMFRSSFHSGYLRPSPSPYLDTGYPDFLQPNRGIVLPQLRGSMLVNGDPKTVTPTGARLTTPKKNKITCVIPIRQASIAKTTSVNVVFSVNRSNGSTLQKNVVNIRLGGLISKFNKPQLAPSINVTSVGHTSTLVTIKQSDINADGYILYRKIITPSSTVNSYPAAEVARGTLHTYDADAFINDIHGSTFPVIYRVVATCKGNVGEEISGAVSTSYNPEIRTVAGKNLLENFSILTAKNNEWGVTIKASSITSTDCTAMYVVARDISGIIKPRIQSFHPRVVGGTATLYQEIKGKSTPDAEFFDTAAQPGRKYHYRFMLVKSDGSHVEARGSTIHTYILPPPQNIRFSIKNPSESGIGKRRTVKFNLDASFMTAGLESLVERLASIGASSSFIDNINANRQKYSKLTAFLVDRINMSNGIRETFGVVPPGMFVDGSILRSKLGVLPLKDGVSYMYEVTVLVRSPMTLFKGLVESEKDSITLVNFEKDFRKFLNPITEKTSTTPSQALLDGVVASTHLFDSNDFIQGITSVKDTYTTTSGLSSSIIKSINCYKVQKNTVISWEIEGSSHSIDHFLVYCTYAGVKTVVGATHLYGNPGLLFTHTDKKLSGAVGKKIYCVRPVYNNFSLGSPSEDYAVSTTSNMPNVELGR